MGYPGDRGQPGGWDNEQPPSPPYGDDPRRPESPHYGQRPFDAPLDDAALPPLTTGDPERPGTFARPVGRPGEYGSGDGTGPGFGHHVAGTYEYGGHRRTDPASRPQSAGGPAGPGTPGDPSATVAAFGDAARPISFDQDPYEQNAYEQNAYEQGPYDQGSHEQGSYEQSGSYGQGRYEPDSYERGSRDESAYGARGNRPDSYESYDAYGSTGSGKRRMPLIIGATAAGLLVLGAGGVGLSAILRDEPKKADGAAASGQSSTGAGSAPSAAAPTPTPSAPLGSLLKSRTTDPSPLALPEVFKKAAFTADGDKYVMTARSGTTKCAKVVHGAAFGTALQQAGCTQVLRATYARTDGKLIGTIGVINLRTEEQAKDAARAATAKDAWVLPLTGKGTTSKIGTGIALGTAETRGHYLVTTWVQRPSGEAIPADLRKEVTTFGRAVALGSNLTTALQYRGITGKPYAK